MSEYGDYHTPSPKKGKWGKILALMIVILILFATFPLYAPQLRNILSVFGLYPNPQPNAPDFNLTSFKAPSIIPPSYYVQLSSYVLGFINQNRTSNGLSSVIQSPILSAQQHAESMLANSYFSHWDTQGLKPYMRYSLYNGTGSVEENVAWERSPLGFLSISSVENALQQLEWQMMNNDSVCCNNGHRDNILNSIHNTVAIGVVYDQNNVYLVQDFENDYVSWTTYPTLAKNGIFSMSGQLASSSMNPSVIYIYFDSFPQSLTSAQLKQRPYNGTYDPGSPLACVVKTPLVQCSVSGQPLTTEVASTWTENSTGFLTVSFDGASLIQNAGKGVYTLYLISGSTDSLTSISFFVSG